MTMAEAFNAWMRRYIDEPERFEREWQTVLDFWMDERWVKGEPEYGARAAAYLRQLMREKKPRTNVTRFKAPEVAQGMKAMATAGFNTSKRAKRPRKAKKRGGKFGVEQMFEKQRARSKLIDRAIAKAKKRGGKRR